MVRSLKWVDGAANEVLEKVASFGLLANMIIYLTATYHMKPAAAAVVLLLWGAISNFLPIFGAFLADSWLGKFRVIAAGSFFSLTVSRLQSLSTGSPRITSISAEYQSFTMN